MKAELNPYEPPRESPREPWLSPPARLIVLLILYVIARAFYAIEFGK